ncbi:FAD-binding oxidoreductase [Pseudohalocynthiibacter aestuariivivens]|nr:FAD-binding and (Fe-S)-binding domain-containing protein [Pseudohalocynthiibacter aestuariivivens]QIE45989.1 FAD-binding oxidoreductase [Pseudohalocynthiibacter aestuariivivens]
MSVTEPATYDRLILALKDAGFRGDAETDTALRAAMSTDNSFYSILPDLVVAPRDAEDVVCCLSVLDRAEFATIPVTARGGGTGTNGQSLNHGVVFDMRRYMTRLLAVDQTGEWADVEPGIVLDDLNAQLRSHNLFFAPETSSSTRCTLGGMLSTDASGKGSRIYGKTSDNLLGVEIARAQGLVSSMALRPDWAAPMLDAAEQAARSGRQAFIDNTPKLNRRFTGYDLERACPENGGFEWWRLLPGSEGTLGPITRIRIKLRRLPAAKRLVLAGFSDLRSSLAVAEELLAFDPTAIEVLDERVQTLAREAGLLDKLPEVLRAEGNAGMAYAFIEFNGDDAEALDSRARACQTHLRQLPGFRAVYLSDTTEEIRKLWAIRSAGVGLLGKVKGRARPVSFVEDCVVPPDTLPEFLDGFLEILGRHGLDFGIYGHVDVGCLHIRPALDIDSREDRERLVQISNEVFALVNVHGGIFWGEHGKGVRGAYLEEWIGPKAYAALQAVKRAFDPSGRFNPGKLVATDTPVMGIGTTPFRPFNPSREGDPLEKAFQCNGNAQCLSYAATTPMCPSFKATQDLRYSPKGRADALRSWHRQQDADRLDVEETDLLDTLDTCLGCKACASSCPVQVDIPTMRAAFYARYYAERRRPLADRAMLLAERFSPWIMRVAPLARPVWPLVRRGVERTLSMADLPERIAAPLPRSWYVSPGELCRGDLPPRTVLLTMDWFTALYDGATQRDFFRGFEALGYRPYFVPMTPLGKIAGDLGDRKAFAGMAARHRDRLQAAAATGAPLLGIDPAYVMALRQDYQRQGLVAPIVLLPQEFLAAQVRTGVTFPKLGGKADLFVHCTEATGVSGAREDWQVFFAALGMSIRTPETGCCGMAGIFGHRERHQRMSRKLFDLSWQAPLSSGTEAVATGFSCRCQAARFGGRPLRHPLGLVADRLAT